MAREDSIASYIRFRVNRWLEENRPLGKTAKDLAELGGMAPSNISQVKKGTLGVGAVTMPKFARALGMTVAELVVAAEQWSATHAPAVAAVVTPKDPHRAEAIQVVKSLGRATDAQLEAIVAAYGAERFTGRDTEWWISTLLAELQRDERAETAAAAAHRHAGEVAAARRKGVDRHHAEHRGAVAEKRSHAAAKRPGRKAG